MLNIERSKFLNLLNLNKEIERAEGACLQTVTGEVYYDFTSQYGAVPFGHNPDFLLTELVTQLQRMPGVMVQPFNSSGAKELAELLVSVLPGDMQHVVLACSGAEAVEAAIKLSKSRTRRSRILSTKNSFHGKTMGAVLATGNDYYKNVFYSDHEDFAHIDYNDLSALEEALESKLFAAFIVEPIQGEGGMIEPDPGYLKSCQKLCKRYGTLFIVDEIQTGLGRTGTLFASEHEAIEPDIILLGKALGGGMLPISACVSSSKAWSADFGQRHSSTFANNHLAACVGIKSIDMLRNNHSILENINSVGQYLSTQLKKLVNEFPNVYSKTSGRGLMQGIALAPWMDTGSYFPGLVYESGYAVALVSSYLLNTHHLLTAPTLNANQVLRIQPNYLIDRELIDLLIFGLRDVAQKLNEGDFASIMRSAMGMPAKVYDKKSSSLPFCVKRPAQGPKLGVFAFLMHPTTIMEAVDGLPGGLSAYSTSEIERAIQWIEQCKSVSYMAATAYHIPVLKSRQAGFAEGWLIVSPLSPQEMMRLPKSEKAKLLDSFITEAQTKGADMIGLGAFTSVISRGGTMLKECGTSVTTGNSYTALTSTDAIRIMCRRLGKNLNDSRAGIVGAAGSVGRLCLLDIGSGCKSVCLIGNSRNSSNLTALETVAGEFLTQLFTENTVHNSPVLYALSRANITYERIRPYIKSQTKEAYQQFFLKIQNDYVTNKGSLEDFPVTLTNDINSHLGSCNIVITATSNGEAFITSELIARNAIICDVARPSDLVAQLEQDRPDVVIIEGGLVSLPEYIRFGHANIVGLETGISLACLSETIILTMEQASGSYSIGGNSSLKEARQIFEWGSKHGFSTYLPDTGALNEGMLGS